MRPRVKYRGGKARELPQILRNLPAYRGRYVEPFVGGGALFFHPEPGQAIVNDINDKLANFYLGVRNDYSRLHSELLELENLYESNWALFNALKLANPKERIPNANESLYYRLRNMYNGLLPAEYSPALLYYFINKTAYSGMIRHNARGEYNVLYGRYRHFWSDGVTLAHSQLLQRAHVLQGDYRQVFDLLETEDFVFLDPPYDCQFTDYGNTEYRDGFGEDEQIRLAEDFRNLPCRAMLIIGKTPLTERLYRGHIAEEYAKSYAVNIRNRFQAGAIHMVVTNYELPKGLRFPPRRCTAQGL